MVSCNQDLERWSDSVAKIQSCCYEPNFHQAHRQDLLCSHPSMNEPAIHSIQATMVVRYFAQVWQQVSQEPSSTLCWLIYTVGSLYAFYLAGLVAYRLTLHPLAHIPGPFLCRVSYLQQAYYEAILQGKFIHEIPKYHEKYGPVVRLSPHEVHVNDITIFHEIFSRNRGFTKDPVTYSVGPSNAMTMTIQVEAHKAKRQVLDPVFSKRRINMMEDRIYGELELVLGNVGKYHQRDEEVPIHELFYCYTADIVSELLFGKSLNMIAAPDFLERVKDMQLFTGGVWAALHFKMLRKLITGGPRWLAAHLSESPAAYLARSADRLSRQAHRQGLCAPTRYADDHVPAHNAHECGRLRKSL
ncbi:cytochrome P450 [Xylaria longipes]|nr:cytochrome P450 [Xylaria longipes]